MFNLKEKMSYEKEYLINQIISYQQKTPNTSVMTPIFLRDFNTHQLRQYLETVKKGYYNGIIWQYSQYILIFLFGFIFGKLFF